MKSVFFKKNKLFVILVNFLYGPHYQRGKQELQNKTKLSVLTVKVTSDLP